MQKFGFEQQGGNDHYTQWLSRIDGWYVLLLLLFFGVLSYISWMSRLITTSNTDTYISATEKVALFMQGLDPDIAELTYHIGNVAEAMIDNTGLFPAHEASLEAIAHYGSGIDDKWGDRLPSGKQYLRALFHGFATYQTDVFSLLGKEESQTYLVILQNTAEKRPNGGFFGSFAKVTLDKGRVENVEVIDSYLPGFDKPGTYVTGPAWLTNFLPEREIYFVGANKIGFTYHDGAYIKTLYEKSYPGQRIRGVVFISTDMFSDVMPGFREQLWEWQFINASVDLIRGGSKRGKKELYLASANEYFTEHAKDLAIYLFAHLDELIEHRYINMYLTDMSGSFHTRLRENKLTTRFEEDTMYFWDSNISYSKVDAFVDKIIQFRDKKGNIVIETMEDIVHIGDLAPGAYTVSIIYNLHVPEHYVDYIHNLETKYGITLSEREIHILALQPRRATRGVIYMPKHISLMSIDGDRYHEDEFSTPFSSNIYYKAKMLENNSVSEVVMEIEIN